MNGDEFDVSIGDSQGTAVSPIDPERFDLERYRDYEASLLEGNRSFRDAEAGIQVYRRFRIPEVFSYACRDMRLSLALQLAGLEKSMEYRTDIANFLEPWYGIGTIAAAFGIEYIWKEGQAPATEPRFATVREALECEPLAVEQTRAGRHTLEMIEYFLEMTRGMIPISPADVQSPFNTASYLIDTTSFYLSVIDHPEDLQQLLLRINDLSTAFLSKQIDLIGDALALPGHGFASSRAFRGLGMSDDTMMMVSPQQYRDIVVPANGAFGRTFDGTVFHSCGNWVDKIDAVKSIDNLLMVDGAFSKETDPDANPAEPFAERFAGSGIILQGRIVGGERTVLEKVRELWRPCMKLIAVTYCRTPEEQNAVYEKIHRLCTL